MPPSVRLHPDFQYCLMQTVSSLTTFSSQRVDLSSTTTTNWVGMERRFQPKADTVGQEKTLLEASASYTSQFWTSVVATSKS